MYLVTKSNTSQLRQLVWHHRRPHILTGFPALKLLTPAAKICAKSVFTVKELHSAEIKTLSTPGPAGDVLGLKTPARQAGKVR